MTAAVILEESVADPSGWYLRRWTCTPPSMDHGFVVVREEWNADYTVRTIHEWTPA